jgi:hypothetical protein
MLVVGGCPAKVRIEEPVHFLGEVMRELGMISPEQHEVSLGQARQSSRLHGEVMLELGIVDPPTLDAGLRSQVERKVELLFGRSIETTFNYFDNLDLLQGYGGGPAPIDPFPVLWRGVRESPAWEHVDATLRRVGGAWIRASATAQFERFAFLPEELQAIEMLRQRPSRVVDITAVVGPSVGQLLVYLLMIMKQVDLDAARVEQRRPAPPAPPAPPSSGQAFARVQLQRQAPKNALVVEEVVGPTSGNDERASVPGGGGGGAFGRSTGAFAPIQLPPEQPEEAPAPRPASPSASDIGALISHTIEQSVPPPAPSIPPPPGMPDVAPPSGQESAPPSADGVLTSEQATLKTKILERAEQITSQDYFQMLGLGRDATAEQIQKAFFALAKVWHPDRLPPALVDVKDACGKVFTHLTEAHATLTDAAQRQDYMTLLRDGGATPDDQAKIQAILEAATEFQKADILLKRNSNDPQAFDIVKRCVELDPEQAEYVATLAWLEAHKPEWLSKEKTLEKCLVLERCVAKNPNCERAFFYRGMLYKRAGEIAKALKDFKRAADLNPRNLDAIREVRLHNMRGGGTPGKPAAPGTKPTGKAPEPESLGGFLGKLFKK